MPDDPTAIDLALATEEELLEELARRNTGLFVVMCRDVRGQNEPSKELFSCRWRGGAATALGLARYGLWYITAHVCSK